MTKKYLNYSYIFNYIQKLYIHVKKKKTKPQQNYKILTQIKMNTEKIKNLTNLKY